VLDERWIRSLHVEAMREGGLHRERHPHVLFQASTIGALLDGAFDGDLTIAELGERGDLGLGTLNGLDGEMIVIDGGFHRADVDGRTHPIGHSERTPFAVVSRFSPTVDTRVDGPLDHAALLERIEAVAPPEAQSFAVRIDGRFELVRARSVPRQEPPYRPLTEVVAEQSVFELTDVVGSMVGFRFPAYLGGIEVPGYHLHFIDDDRTRGGHVLDSRVAGPLRVRIDPSDDLHVELPPGVDLGDPEVAGATHAVVELVERGQQRR
jgi:acetolactate decarboxylase